MSAYGTFRTSPGIQTTSVFGGEADPTIARVEVVDDPEQRLARGHPEFMPIAGHQSSHDGRSRRNRAAERRRQRNSARWLPGCLNPAATRRFDQGLSCSSEMSLFV